MDNIKLDNAAILEALAKLAVSADNPDAASAIANLAAQLGETTLQPEYHQKKGVVPRICDSQMYQIRKIRIPASGASRDFFLRAAGEKICDL
mgnify:CR=1 FL=1